MTDSVRFGVCPACGSIMFPVLALQPCGHDGPPELHDLDAEGVVYSWSRSWTSKESSVLIAMADFLDGRLRITAPVVAADEVAIGDRMRAVAGEEPQFFLRPVG